MISKLSDGGRLPKIVVFDLDDTLWSKAIHKSLHAPLNCESNAINEVIGSQGHKLSLYPEVPEVLERLKNNHIRLIVASCTPDADVARECLDKLIMPCGKTAMSYFEVMEIFSKSKINHFKEIHEKTGVDYCDMLFFDDKPKHLETEKLGVTMYQLEKGINLQAWQEGLGAWKERHGYD